jgi:hypothetical protein
MKHLAYWMGKLDRSPAVQLGLAFMIAAGRWRGRPQPSQARRLERESMKLPAHWWQMERLSLGLPTVVALQLSMIPPALFLE